MDKINWEEEFNKTDAEYMNMLHKARKEQLRKIGIELIVNANDERELKFIVNLMAKLQNKQLIDKLDEYSLVALKGGVA